ncbi:MAG: Gfo/Idh/MocA family oxidoreductase [Halodesulfurarchaeum sp.]
MSIDTNSANRTLDAGVIGVGSMGRNHARVYSELLGVNLVGVSDVEGSTAMEVATAYGSRAMSRSMLLAAADVVSVAVPTQYHYEVVRECIEAGVHVLVEKPFVQDLEKGRELAALAREADVTLQVGHIERFNPVTRVLADIVPDLDVVAIDIDRLGPPLDRENDDSVVMDLMVHDIDILLSLVDSEIESLSATAHDDRHVAVQFRFDDDSIAALTASRLTQEKIRTLSVTAHSCRVNVDFISQTVEIYRRSLPEYVETDGDVRYRHESVVERPTIENGEPLKAELEAFADAVRNGTEPIVTAEDALDVMAVANSIESIACETRETSPLV